MRSDALSVPDGASSGPSRFFVAARPRTSGLGFAFPVAAMVVATSPWADDGNPGSSLAAQSLRYRHCVGLALPAEDRSVRVTSAWRTPLGEGVLVRSVHWHGVEGGHLGRMNESGPSASPMGECAGGEAEGSGSC